MTERVGGGATEKRRSLRFKRKGHLPLERCIRAGPGEHWSNSRYQPLGGFYFRALVPTHPDTGQPRDRASATATKRLAASHVGGKRQSDPEHKHRSRKRLRCCLPLRPARPRIEESYNHQEPAPTA